MSLKPIVETLDDVPEALREHFIKREDGKFALDADPEGLETLIEPRIRPLKAALERQKEEAKKSKERLLAFEDVDPDEYRRLKDEDQKRHTKKKAGDGDEAEIEAEIDRRTKEALKRHEQEKEGVEARLRETETLLDTQVKDSAIKTAAIDVGVRKKSVEAAVLLARPYVKRDGLKTLVVDDEGEVRYGKSGEPMSLKDLVEEIATNHDLLEGSEGTGTSHQGGKSGRMPTKKASEMSQSEKRAFIREHGVDEWEKFIERG